jgi:anti-sigma factor RsiW
MADLWMEKLDAYLDGELSESDSRALHVHLKGCTDCAAQIANKIQMKRAIHNAGLRFKPDPAFRARIENSIATPPARRLTRGWIAAFASLYVALAIAIVALNLRQPSKTDKILSELADLHVATLASSNPVDVVSTDRHTVKPWFAGKIPFTFNLPELQNTPFTLAGGRVSYLNQSPGAELIFRVRQHQISVFIFQEQALENIRLPDATQNAQSFNIRSWTKNGLRYFAVSDVNPSDIDALAELIKTAR